MKKLIITFCLIGCFCFAFTGCKKEKESNSTEPQNTIQEDVEKEDVKSNNSNKEEIQVSEPTITEESVAEETVEPVQEEKTEGTILYGKVIGYENEYPIGVQITKVKNGIQHHIVYKYPFAKAESSLGKPNGYPEYFIPIVLEKDMNFDGVADFMISQGAYGNQGVGYYTPFIWDDSKQQYLENTDFSSIGNPVVDEADNRILSFTRDSAVTYIYRSYKYDMGKYILETTITEEYTDNGKVYTIVSDDEVIANKIAIDKLHPDIYYGDFEKWYKQDKDSELVLKK